MSEKEPQKKTDLRPVALVTGGSRGIGFGCAEKLAEAGYDLAINGIKPEEEIQDALSQLRERGADVLYCQGNIGDPVARKSILGRIKDYFHRLHVLVNNAGIAPRERKDILEASEESYDEVMSINLKGPYFLTQAAAHWMIEQKEFDKERFYAIINIGSISATVASVNRGEYCVAKAGIGMMTSLFATRLGEYGISVYELRPGVTRTDMTAGVTDKYDRLIQDGLCITRRWGTPEDIGKAVASLARGDFPYSTGQAIYIDGGLTLPRL